LRDNPHEVFYVIFLNTKNHVIHHEALFRGTIDSADVPIREVVKEALDHNAANVIVAHNHPSGVAEPSQSDKSLTSMLSMALAMVGMKLLDHLVVGEGEVVSFAEQGLMES
jgi:DNA repair protein RadC